MLELSGAWELPDSSIARGFGPELRDLVRAQDPAIVFYAKTWLREARLGGIKKKITYGGVLYVGKFGSRLIELTCLKPKLLIRFIVNKTC